jgi:hypothetical protein
VESSFVITNTATCKLDQDPASTAALFVESIHNPADDSKKPINFLARLIKVRMYSYLIFILYLIGQNLGKTEKLTVLL